MTVPDYKRGARHIVTPPPQEKNWHSVSQEEEGTQMKKTLIMLNTEKKSHVY